MGSRWELLTILHPGKCAEVQPWLIQGVQSGDGVGVSSLSYLVRNPALARQSRKPTRRRHHRETESLGGKVETSVSKSSPGVLSMCTHGEHLLVQAEGRRPFPWGPSPGRNLGEEGDRTFLLVSTSSASNKKCPPLGPPPSSPLTCT